MCLCTTDTDEKYKNIPWPVTSAPVAPASADPPGRQSVSACKPPAPRPAAAVSPRSAVSGCVTLVYHGCCPQSQNVMPAPAVGLIKSKRWGGVRFNFTPASLADGQSCSVPPRCEFRGTAPGRINPIRHSQVWKNKAFLTLEHNLNTRSFL